MPIPFRCPYCGHETLVEDQYAGRSGPCVRCGQTITVPVPQQHPAQMPGHPYQATGPISGGGSGMGPALGSMMPGATPAPAGRGKSSVSPATIGIIVGSGVLLIVAVALLIGGLSGGGAPPENRETAKSDVSGPRPAGVAAPSASGEAVPSAASTAGEEVPGAHSTKGGGGFSFSPRSIFDRRAIQASGPEMRAQCFN
ncbi:MAG: hypothetical protein D6741_08005, partial [Planctomycetota bacterium]